MHGGEARPDSPLSGAALAHYTEGRRLHAAGDLHGGLRELQAALAAAPDHPDVLDALALLAADGGDLASTERILRHLQQRVPTVQRAVRLAIVVYKQQRYVDALPLFEAIIPAISFNPDISDAYAFCLEQAGNRVRSLAVYEDILARAPSPARAMRVVVALDRAGEQGQLAARLPEWLSRWPDHKELLAAAAINRLGARDFAAGWQYMRRHVVDACDARVAGLRRWDGAPFAGTLVVVAEPHLGEAILMSSPLADLAACGQAVLMAIDARLLPLYQRSFPSFTFVPREGDELARHIAAGGELRRATALDLVERFRREAVFPGTAAWLRADPARVQRKREEYRARWPGKRLVGISWRSLRRFDDGKDGKSIPLASLARTLSTPDTVFIDLQYGDFRAECDAFPAAGLAAPWRDPEIDPTRDIDGLAAQLCALDEAVMVSNTTAHLAGALGVPVTVLLPREYPVLWHWCWEGERTPWYGSVRLLRNPERDGFSLLDHALAAVLARAGG